MCRSPDRFWSIPELREQVCSYLNNRSLAALRLVSKALPATCHPFFRLQVNVIFSTTGQIRSEPKLPPDYLMESSGLNVNALVMVIPNSVWPQPRSMLPWYQYLNDETVSISGLYEVLGDQAEEENGYRPSSQRQGSVSETSSMPTYHPPTDAVNTGKVLPPHHPVPDVRLTYYEESLGPEFDVFSQDRSFCARLDP